MKELRPYQKKVVSEFREWFNLDEKLATIVLPTGTGKSFSAASCIQAGLENEHIQVLWAAHREELINQAHKELSALLPNCSIDIEMAEQRANPDSQIIIGTVQTLHRNRKNMKDFSPGLVVVDEWHHYSEDNKQYHSLMEKYPQAKFLALTATPYRFSGGDLPLGRKLIEMDIGTAVENNYLVPPIPKTLRTKTSLANVKTRAGDFAIDELSKTVNNNDRNQLIANTIIGLVKEGRQGILFGVDVAHAKAMYELLKDHVRAEQIYGETDKEERREIIQKVSRREVDVVVNNLVCTEGWDAPHLSFVCIARPTKSLGLFVQMAGRGLRLFDNKKDCIILDVVDTIKVTQSRITFADFASTGDLDGNNKRINKIMELDIPDPLKNFPVFIPKENQTWTVDNETWFAPSWVLAENHWAIAWAKRDTRKETDEIELVPFTFRPSAKILRQNPIEVFSAEHGNGLMFDFSAQTEIAEVLCGNEKFSIPLYKLQKRTKKFIKVKLDKPIIRIFYVCQTQDKKKCRLISLLQDGKDFRLVDDQITDATTANELIKVTASEDDMEALVKADAKWRNRPASVKQIELIKKYMMWGRADQSLDLAGLTGGDASAIMDQVNHANTIIKLFGAKKESDLVGYSKITYDQ